MHELRSSIDTLRTVGARFWLEVIFWGVGVAVLIGIPTVLIPNNLFRRMTPTRWWDFLVWAVAALLTGAVMASRRLNTTAQCRVEGRAIAGGTFAFLAVGCPICNKIVVALLGTSGALAYFAPIQPLLGALSIGLLILTLHRSLRQIAVGEGNELSVASPASQ